MLMNLYGKAKTSEMVTVICGIKNIQFLPPRFLVFLACRVTSKVLGICVAERSWGDVNIIKSRKRSAIISDVSEKQSIVYTSACIESARIEQYHSDRQIYDNSSSHTWNEEGDAFDQQLYKWGAERVFSDCLEPFKRDLRAYIKYWEIFLIVER